MKLLKKGNSELFIVNDKAGTHTYTHDFAQNVKLLVEKELWGLYNMVCEGLTGRLEVAKELVNILGLEKKVKITTNKEVVFGEGFISNPDFSEYSISKIHGTVNFESEEK